MPRSTPIPQHLVAVPQPLPDDAAATDPLLRFAGPIAGSHALVLAPNGAEWLCRLLRHGCAAAMSLRMAERPDHEAYDLVLAPCVAEISQIGRLLYQAKRALVPTGRFLACVPATAPAEVARLLVRSLQPGGFAAVQTQTGAQGLFVRSDLPMLGFAGAMPRLVGGMA